MPISKRLRYEVLRRDNHTCRYCGAKAPDVELQVDHVVPEALGGKTAPENLATACSDCNAGKASTSPDSPLVEGVGDDAIRWAKAMQMASEAHAKQREVLAQQCEEFDAAWCYWKHVPPGKSEEEPLPRPSEWRQSVETWLCSGLTLDDLKDGVRIAMEKNMPNVRVWRYFCGVMWRRLEGRHDLARHLIDTEQA